MANPTGLFMDAEKKDAELERLQKNIAAIIKNVATENTCRGATCGAKVYWFLHKNGKRACYDADLTNHFITCPDQKQFRGPRSDKAAQ